MFPDELDLRLLKELKEDSRRSVRQLAKSLKESPSTVYNRVKRLEAKSVIRGWTVNLDYGQLDLDHIAFVFVSIDTNYLNGTTHDLKGIVEKIKEVAGIHEMHIFGGIALRILENW
jgi:DNA-binding Lrp family transcriptional regulator